MFYVSMLSYKNKSVHVWLRKNKIENPNAGLTAWAVVVLYKTYTGGAERRHDNALLLCIPH